LRFTALLHHIYNLDTLRMAYFSRKKEAAPGVDGETWRHYREELEGNLQDLSERLGSFAIDNRQKRGEGKPETFNFLGFTHICVKKRSNGRFTVLRQTIRKRLQAKLNEVKAELQRRMHEPIPTPTAMPSEAHIQP
jgi:retron-type reverse transcriptase